MTTKFQRPISRKRLELASIWRHHYQKVQTWIFQWCNPHARTTNNKDSVWPNFEKSRFLAVFQGCHSNREGCQAETWYVNSSCSAERTIICFNAVAQIVSEILPKNCFSRFLLWFSRKIYLLRHFFEYRHANGLACKLMIFQRSSRARILEFRLSWWENRAQIRHCRWKIMFFAVAMATEFPNANFGPRCTTADATACAHQVSSASG